jgi:hypothetical protein
LNFLFLSKYHLSRFNLKFVYVILQVEEAPAAIHARNPFWVASALKLISAKSFGMPKRPRARTY